MSNNRKGWHKVRTLYCSGLVPLSLRVLFMCLCTACAWPILLFSSEMSNDVPCRWLPSVCGCGEHADDSFILSLLMKWEKGKKWSCGGWLWWWYSNNRILITCLCVREQCVYAWQRSTARVVEFLILLFFSLLPGFCKTTPSSLYPNMPSVACTI